MSIFMAQEPPISGLTLRTSLASHPCFRAVSTRLDQPSVTHLALAHAAIPTNQPIMHAPTGGLANDEMFMR